MKFAFATKIELKHKDIERKIGIFLILNIQNYSLPKIVNDHEEFISLNGSNKIINSLDIEKVPS